MPIQSNQSIGLQWRESNTRKKQDKPNTRASLLRVEDLRSSENDSTPAFDQSGGGWKFESDVGWWVNPSCMTQISSNDIAIFFEVTTNQSSAEIAEKGALTVRSLRSREKTKVAAELYDAPKSVIRKQLGAWDAWELNKTRPIAYNK